MVNFVHEFDKGCGFTIVTNGTAEEKMEEQLGKATKDCKLRKENKFTNKIF